VPSPHPERWQQKIADSSVGIGNAVLSRWPIIATDHLHLPAGNEPAEGRTALHASVDSPVGPLPVFTTQLNAPPHHSAVRCQQAVALAEFVAARRTGAFPPVLTGDFYILVGLPHKDGRGHVGSVRMVGHGPEGGVWPSDHAGVLAELRFGGPVRP
jgi:endonuclease/exonuclease/phosphatase family metal-dependent hydrolase